jgi:SAM-dependent methyltransferase
MILDASEVLELTGLTGWRFVNHELRKRLLIDRARRHFPRGIRVADLGCAAGDLTLELAGLGFDMLGIDHEPARLARARAMAERRRLAASFVQGDLESVAEPGSFDALILGEVLEHFAEPRAIFERYLAFLKPAGIVLLTVPNMASLRARVKLFVFGEFADHNPEHRYYFTRRRLVEHLGGLPLEYLELFTWIVELTLPATTGWARLERRALEPLRAVAPWCGAHLVAVARKRESSKTAT